MRAELGRQMRHALADACLDVAMTIGLIGIIVPLWIGIADASVVVRLIASHFANATDQTIWFWLCAFFAFVAYLGIWGFGSSLVGRLWPAETAPSSQKVN